MLLVNDDCLSYLKTIAENSIDSLVTDPPAGISFMGKDWDSGNNFIPAMTEIFKEALKVLKPGAHGLVWALPRTSHWTATALEQAGFEIRDVVTHLFGSGFPKSLDISKAIDKAAGAEREVVGQFKYRPNDYESEKIYDTKVGDKQTFDITAPSTDEAKQWQGWGTALKPASEHWILIRKPLSEKTVAANVLKWGTGGINIDDCRIPCEPIKTIQGGVKSSGGLLNDKNEKRHTEFINTQGRFPANLVLDEVAAEMLDEQSGVLKNGGQNFTSKKGRGMFMAEGLPENTNHGKTNFAGDSGGASRFFYCAKASKKDRNEGCEELPEVECQTGCGGEMPIDDNGKERDRFKKKAQNHHPTVKSTKLMEYLITLITPPGGTVLDPFMGSGSTGKAAIKLGFDFVGVEKDSSYFEISRKRISSVQDAHQDA